MPTTRNRIDRLAIDLDVGRTVPVPYPGVRRADRIHHQLLQHPRQRPSPNLQCSIGCEVHPHVVVFVMGTRCLPGLGAVATVVEVRRIRLAKQGALPLASLLQEDFPRDLTVVGRVELAVLHVFSDRVRHVVDHLSIVGQPDHGGHEALGDAEREVDPFRVSPLCDDVAVPENDSSRATTLLRQRTLEFSEFLLVPRVVVRHDFAVVGLGVVDDLLDQCRVHADLRGRAMFPSVARPRIVMTINLIGPTRRTSGPSDGRERHRNQSADGSATHDFLLGPQVSHGGRRDRTPIPYPLSPDT